MSLRLKALFWELRSHRIKVKYFVWASFVPALGASAEALRFLLDLASSLERGFTTESWGPADSETRGPAGASRPGARVRARASRRETCVRSGEACVRAFGGRYCCSCASARAPCARVCFAYAMPPGAPGAAATRTRSMLAAHTGQSEFVPIAPPSFAGMQEQLTSRSWGGHSDSRASPMPEGALASARPWSAVSDIRASPMSSLHHSAQILPLRHIPVVLPAEVGGAVYGTPSVENHPRRQYPQAFEYLNITDVDALRSMIEKLVDDAEQFTADIRRKDHIITDLQVKVLSLEGHLDTAGMHQNQIASKFEALQRMHEEEIQRVLRDFDEQTAALKQAQAALYDAENRRRELETRLEEAARLTEELDYVKAQALHHAKYRDEALKQCDKLKLMVSAADAENFSLKKDIEITKRNLASAEDNAVTLNEMLHQEREINAEFRYTSV